MLNLSALAAKDQAEIPVFHPVTGEPTEATITLAGPSSEEYAAARQRLAEARTALPELTPQAAKELSMDLLLDCMVTWKGISLDGKKAFPFSRENAKTLLTNKKYFWLEDQIDRALVHTANFIGA